MKKNNVLISAKDVFKEYKMGRSTLRVLNGITLEVAKGERLIVVGPSGAGKSTLLHILGLLDTPTSGKVFYKGEDLGQLSPGRQAETRNKHFGFVFQFYHLLPDFIALENVMLPRLISPGAGWSTMKKEGREKAMELLRCVGLADRAHHRPDQLSGGERQRVAFARALMNDPDVLFCDEPTGNLDSENAGGIWELIVRLNETNQQTFVIITHDEHFASRGTRTVGITDGRIAEQKPGGGERKRYRI
ncbi:MAG TPA: ABC transporter ATP-binding protein [Candidatus Tripitaka californicus]|uniref:ABC transporter ATP-binding protein n=1 Tax=Candidatus Tripitaka californicus TaxID=3367616 RepID=UPI0040286EB4|nr:ABC transporter ATP-binding protein [Planctomycetota bacterium]